MNENVTKTSPIKQAIYAFLANGKENGFMPLPAPTASGKTYNVKAFMTEFVELQKRNPKPKDIPKKCFFITPRIDNIPHSYQDYVAFFESDEEAKAFFDENVLFLKSRIDYLIEHFDSVKKDIPREIRDLDEFSKLVKDLKFYHALRDKGMQLERKAEMARKSEPEFRRKIGTMFRKEFKTPKERKEEILVSDKWAWLSKLYPETLIYHRSIILMSMDKFIYQFDPICEVKCYLYQSDLIANSIIFFDEFDSTKKTIEKQLIKESVSHRYDPIQFFGSLYRAFREYSPPNNVIESAVGKRDFKSDLAKIKNMGASLYQEYSLHLSIQASPELAKNKQSLLFQDSFTHGIIKGKKQKLLAICYDEKPNVNRLSLKDAPKDSKLDKVQNFDILLKNIDGYITYVTSFLNDLVDNYQNAQSKKASENQTSYREEFPRDYAISTIFENIRLDGETREILQYRMNLQRSRKRKKRNQANALLPFYEHGYSYVVLNVTPRINEDTRIYRYEMKLTPEWVLLETTLRAKVVGLSATVGYESVFTNYDLAYLREQLYDAYYYVPKEISDEIAEEFYEGRKHYADNVTIHVQFLDEIKEKICNVFSNEENPEEYFQEILKILPQKEGEKEETKRYQRFAWVYREFQKLGIHSLLALSSKFPGGKGKLDENLIRFMNQIAQHEGIDEKAEEYVRLLDSQYHEENQTELSEKPKRYFEKNRDAINAEFRDGKRLMVFSSYATVGAGQNLQYKIPDSQRADCVYINDARQSDEKDYDAIYLDKPSYVIPFLKREDARDEEKLMSFLYALESLCASGAISRKEMNKTIHTAFLYRDGETNIDTLTLPKNHMKRIAYTQYLDQACGRICRTNCKSKDIYIFLDAECKDLIDPAIALNQGVTFLFNEELKAIFAEYLKSQNTPKILETERVILRNKSENNSAQLAEHLSHCRNTIWRNHNEEYSLELIEWIQRFKTYLLQHPTLSEKKFLNCAYPTAYIKKPSVDTIVYFDKGEHDYFDTVIRYEQSNEARQSISAEEVQLYDLMQNEDLLRFFKAKGYATEFPRSEYILSPSALMCFYKGELGEVVGKYTLEKFLHDADSPFSLSHIPSPEVPNPALYEFMDYKVEGLPIYIDFKHWRGNSVVEVKEMCEKVSQKASKLPNCHHIFLINTLDTYEKEIPEIQRLLPSVYEKLHHEIELIQIPSLYVKANPDSDTLLNQKSLVFLRKKVEEIAKNYHESNPES